MQITWPSTKQIFIMCEPYCFLSGCGFKLGYLSFFDVISLELLFSIESQGGRKIYSAGGRVLAEWNPKP